MKDDETEHRLKAEALQITAMLPRDQDEALRIIGHVCELIRWRRGTITTPKPTLTVLKGGTP
jgi:hypothetical protein